MRLIQRYVDRLILGTVKLWIIVRAYPHWRKHVDRMKKMGVDPVRVTLPVVADEKFFWRKLFDHNPLFVTLSDKIACKEWVMSQKIDARMPATLWVGRDANDIPDELWQRPCYLKASHGYNMNIPILSPPENKAEIVAKANSFLDLEHGREANEWAYRHVPRRLLLEEALFVDRPMIEVKYYTFGSIVEQFVLTRRGEQTVSARWIRQDDGGFSRDDRPTLHAPNIDPAPLPPSVETGLRLASEIGAYFDQMRIDTMSDDETVYLGEVTVYNNSGLFHLYGHLRGSHMNRSWDLRKAWFLTERQPWPWRIYASVFRRVLDRREVREKARNL